MKGSSSDMRAGYIVISIVSRHTILIIFQTLETQPVIWTKLPIGFSECEQQCSTEIALEKVE